MVPESSSRSHQPPTPYCYNRFFFWWKFGFGRCLGEGVRRHQPTALTDFSYRTIPYHSCDDSIQKRVVLIRAFSSFRDISNHLKQQFYRVLDLFNLKDRLRWISFHEGLQITVLDCCTSAALGRHFQGCNPRTKILEPPLHGPTLFGPHTWLIGRSVSTANWTSLKMKSTVVRNCSFTYFSKSSKTHSY